MPNSGFTLEIEGFSGPLALLLDLIEQQKLSVSDVSLAQVSDDYIRYIEDRSRIPLSETAQFVLVAATLLLIKSRSLLPSIKLTEEEEEDIRDLEERLRLYAHVRRAAKLLRGQWEKRSYLPSHVPKQEVQFAPAADITVANMHDVLNKLTTALETFTKAPTAKIELEIRLDDVIESVTQRMQQAFTDSFKKMTDGKDKVEAIVNFLAVLELVKRGTLQTTQDAHFADITMQHDEVDTPQYG